MYNRLFHAPRQSFFLFGARSTGKTTLLRARWPKATWIDLLDEARYQRYLANIGDFYDELAVMPKGSRVIVDEVQRLPALLNEVHRLMEERRLTFVLTGSSARKLRRGGVNLLAGRALLRYLHPFVPAELGADFSLERTLTTGCLPIVWSSPAPAETLEAYAQLYLREEIKAEALVRNLAGFARFLPIAALCHGQILSISAVARDAGVARVTVGGFFDVLEDTLLGFRLPAYTPRLRVREKRKPKFYVIDPGLVRALKKHSGALAFEERGHLLEGWVAQILRAYNDYEPLYDTLSYWSPAEAKKTEVDFVLKRGREIVAIEVKSAARLGSSDFAGLRAIDELPRLRRRLLVYGGRQVRRHDGVDVLPVGEFLTLLAQHRL